MINVSNRLADISQNSRPRCDCCTFKDREWISKLILALGVALVVAGCITIAKEALPFKASIAFISTGSVLFIAALILHFSFAVFKSTISDDLSVKEQTLSVDTPMTQGSGHIVTRSLTLPDNLTTIEVYGSVDLEISEGNTNTLSGEDNIINLLEERMDRSRLILIPKSNTSFRATQPLTYRLRIPNLQKLSVLGSGNVRVNNPHSNGTFFCSLLGNSTVHLENLQSTRFKCIHSGNGYLNITGQVHSQNVETLGSGNYLAKNLQSHSTKLRIGETGSGNAYINVSRLLEVNIEGSGNCYYYGNAVLQPPPQRSGTGSLQHLEPNQ